MPGVLLAVTVLLAAPAQALPQDRALVVFPGRIELSGPLDFRQLLITWHRADAAIDLTHTADIRVEGDAVTVAAGLVRPAKDGTAALLIRHQGAEARVSVSVKDFEKAGGVSFRREVIAALSVGGCNAGACHGSPSGKNGFRLSMRGQDPAFDFQQLTRDLGGRRVDRHDPEAALLLLKATGRAPHDGGVRFGPASLAAEVMRGWMREGADDDPGSATLRSLDLLPGDRTLASKTQQLVAWATFADGTARDVTPLTVFTSSDPAVAEVDAFGRVEFRRTGEVALVGRYLGLLRVAQLIYVEPRPGFVWKAPPENNRIDRLAFAKLRTLQLPPSDLCTDDEFLRRATLDLCGRLPTAQEVRDFLADAAATKREAAIDRLLQEPDHVDFWALKWLDVLKATKRALGQQGLVAYRDWLHGHLAKNTPFDRVVRELLTGSGDTFRNGPANYYRVARTADEAAEVTAQLFLGVRIQCAKCHSHPYERWTQDDYYSQAAFFARVDRKSGKGKKEDLPEEIVTETKGEATNPRSGAITPPRFLAGNLAAPKEGEDRRQGYAAWLTSPDNPFFARAVVNRVWFHLLGRGLVEPVDDFRESNPAAHPALLDDLAKEFARDFDLRKTIRTVMRSRVYQLSSRGNDSNRDDTRYFARNVPRMLTAEQLFEAVCDVTGVPEKLPKETKGTRIACVADLESVSPAAKAFLKAFNQPGRDLACECERSSEASLSQALQVLNGPAVQERLTSAGNRLGTLLGRKLSDDEILDELYLSAFARLPREVERAAARDYLAAAADRRRAWEDVFWAALTSREFMLRH